ncbi:hypothetical protein Adt_02929 [Abeliophyllum distichum]|uniref:Uncharacterized protein n=1 Tax=Abeliophyllum distichum TaxID=126358 RepID=A0ABD1VX23_9LAMI
MLNVSRSFIQRKHGLAVGPPTWDSANSQPISLLHPKEAWPRCLALLPGTRPIRSPSPSFIQRKHGLAVGPPTWDSANLQPISFLHPKEAWPRCLALPPGTRPIRSPSPSFIQRKHGLAVGLPTWDSANSQPISFLHPKEVWPRYLTLPPGTRPIRSPPPGLGNRLASPIIVSPAHQAQIKARRSHKCPPRTLWDSLYLRKFKNKPGHYTKSSTPY